MRPDQWELLKHVARGEPTDQVPLALIVDSPWIPGYLGISHLDYLMDPDVWFRANEKIYFEYPEVIFFPSWWFEYGMAIEPSVLGAKIRFWADNTPSEQHTLYRLDDLDRIADYDIQTDGFAALALHRIRTLKQRIFDAGHTLPIVTARGPLCTASFVRGVTELMMDLIDQPARVHQFLDLTTRLTIDWLQAQVEAIGDCVEGIFILDDLVGFLGEKQYLEFAHPCLKQICDAFPAEWIKVYHNDASIEACLEHLPETGFNVLNWGKRTDITDVRRCLQDRMCLMGNVNPLEVGVKGTPEEVKAESLRILRAVGGDGLILSMGGGVSPGMPGANIRAMIDARNEFQREGSQAHT